MLVDYVVTEMGCFDDYLDAAPSAKATRGNVITTFILHVYQCITFNKTIFVTEKLIAKAQLKSLYSRLGFKVIKDLAKYPYFEKTLKQFHYRSRKSKAS